MTIIEMLDQLAEYKAQADALRLDWEQKRTAIMAPVMPEIAALDTEYEPMMEAVTEKAGELEAVVRDSVLQTCASAKGAHLHAIWMKGRVSWDSKKLDGYAAAHPELNAFRSEGAPSVSIRKV